MKMFQIRNRPEQETFNWRRSYLLIITLSILINSVGYLVATDVIETEIEKNNLASVENMKHSYDSYFNEILSLSYNVLRSNSAERLMTSKSLTPDQRTLYAQNILRDISNSVYMNMLTEGFIIGREEDLCLTSQAIAERGVVYDAYFKAYYPDEAAWLSDMFSVEMQGFRLLKNARGETDLFVISAYPYRGSNRIFVAKLDYASICALLEENGQGNGEVYCISDESGRVLYSAGEAPPLNEMESITAGGSKQSFGGVAYVVTPIRSDVAELQYIKLLPRMEYQKNLLRVYLVAMLCYILLILICGALAVWFSRISERLRGRMEARIENQRELLHTAMLRQAFEDRGQPELIFTAENNLSIEGKCYLTALFDFTKKSVPESDEDPIRAADYRALCIYLESHMLECGVFSGARFCEIDGLCVGILGLADMETESQAVKTAVEGLQRQVLLDLDMTFVCTLSEYFYSVSGVAAAYRQGLEIMNLRYLGNNASVFTAEDVEMRMEYEYPLEVEKQLINVLILGQRAEAEEIVREIFSKNTQSRNVNVSLLRLLASEINNTLLKAAMQIDKQGDRDCSELYMLSDQILGIRSPEGALEILLRHIGALCEMSAKNIRRMDEPQSYSKDSRYNRIMEYVEQHYADYDLNVNRIADVFEFTPNWLSRYFKNKTGIGLAEYIVTYRIERSKELLKTGIPVVQVASEVGFVNVSVFRRAFKKHEGIVPNQFRQLVQSSGE